VKGVGIKKGTPHSRRECISRGTDREEERGVSQTRSLATGKGKGRMERLEDVLSTANLKAQENAREGARKEEKRVLNAPLEDHDLEGE